jgi:hypothetical protein
MGYAEGVVDATAFLSLYDEPTTPRKIDGCFAQHEGAVPEDLRTWAASKWLTATPEQAKIGAALWLLVSACS